MNANAKEIKLNTIKPILSRTDLNGKIKSCNKYFTEISGYSEEELIGSNHNIIRHEDMPRVIFKLMWSCLKNHEDILAVVKNQSKTGDYYWVTTIFETKKNVFNNNPEAYLALRKAAPVKAIKAMEPLYEELLRVEKKFGLVASEKYLKNFLEEKDKTYDEYVKEVVNFNGVVQGFFSSMRKLFF